MKAYKLKVDRVLRGEICASAGDVVYDQAGYDYGLASDDTRHFRTPHVSVTLNKNGDYPGFTVPVRDLEPFEAPDFEVITEDHVKLVCRPGSEETCRYLTVDPKGWCCEKITSLKGTLDARVRSGTMHARGDNCEGRRRQA